MTAYIIRRLLLIIPTLFGIMVVNFAIIQFAPGGPVEQVIAQVTGTAVSSTARVSGAVHPTVLGPGESVETVVNVLRLDAPEIRWPRGGSRIEFTFAAGTLTFSYTCSRHSSTASNSCTSSATLSNEIKASSTKSSELDWAHW